MWYAMKNMKLSKQDQKVFWNYLESLYIVGNIALKPQKESQFLTVVNNIKEKYGNKLPVEAEEGDEQTGGKLRYFKLFYNEEYQGRYCGRKPKQAANKAFSSIIKEMKKNGNQYGGFNVDVNFSIRECTRNSKHKEYNYVGVREQLNEPVDVEIKNGDGSIKKITYSFHNKIAKAPKVQEA